jgi:hypothetical protein
VEDPIAEVLARAQRLADVVVAVFRRYGKPLAADLPGEAARVDIQLSDGTIAVMRACRVRTPVDVIANDWFILELPGEEPLAMPGMLCASALAALDR